MPSSAFVSNREFITLFARDAVTQPATAARERGDAAILILLKRRGRRQKQPKHVATAVAGECVFQGNRQVFGKVCPELLSLMNI